MEKNEYHLIIDINSSDVDGAISSGKEEDVASKQQNAFKRLVKYEVVNPFVQSAKHMIMNNVDTYFGSSELSQRIQFSLDAVHTLNASLASGIALSPALGITAGAGAVLGVLLAVGNKALDIIVNANEINNKRIVENQQLTILQGRAGAQFNRSRSGE